MLRQSGRPKANHAWHVSRGYCCAIRVARPSRSSVNEREASRARADMRPVVFQSLVVLPPHIGTRTCTYSFMHAIVNVLKISFACQTLYNPPKARPCKCPWETYARTREHETPIPFVHSVTRQHPPCGRQSGDFPKRPHQQRQQQPITLSKQPVPSPAVSPFIGRTSGSGLWRRDHRTSWARSGGCRRRAGCGRTGRGPA